jgi:hypothetical protein
MSITSTSALNMLCVFESLLLRFKDLVSDPRVFERVFSRLCGPLIRVNVDELSILISRALWVELLSADIDP